MPKKQDRRMPTKMAIRAHWAPILSAKPNDKFDSVEECMEADYCFGCGMLDFEGSSWTERCHISARCDGGSDTVDNLHLLCPTCHKMSEYLSGDAYWKWLRSEKNFTHMALLRVFYGHADPLDILTFGDEYAKFDDATRRALHETALKQRRA